MPGNRYQLIRKIGLLNYKNIYAADKYASYISLCYQTRASGNKPDKETVMFLYGFKKHFRHSEQWEVIVRTISRHFDCDSIVAVPAHTLDLNSLQKLFGSVIERTCPVEPRKYTRATGWQKDYEKSYTVHDNLIVGPRVLLVDDILITGETLGHFKEVLEGFGFEVTPLALGIDYKLPAAPGCELYLYEKKTETDINLAGLRL
jgi:hypothetical protein